MGQKKKGRSRDWKQHRLNKPCPLFQIQGDQLWIWWYPAEKVSFGQRGFETSREKILSLGFYVSLGASLPVHPRLLLPIALLCTVELSIFDCMATSLTCCSVTKSCPTLCGLQSTRLLCSWDFPGKNNWVGCHFLLQGIFQIQGSNPWLQHLLHWQVDSLLLCRLGSPSLWSTWL